MYKRQVKEALDLAASFQQELAILDVMLPDGDGFSLMEKLKGEYPRILLKAKKKRATATKILPEEPISFVNAC